MMAVDEKSLNITKVITVHHMPVLNVVTINQNSCQDI